MPVPGPERRADQDQEDLDLRHRRAHLQLGRLGAEDDQDPDGDRPRVRRRDRGGRRLRAAVPQGRPGRRRGPHRLRGLPQLPGRAAGTCARTRRGSASTAPAPSPSTCASRPRTPCRSTPRSRSTSSPASTPSATRPTRRSSSTSWARTCSSPGAGPIGCMAAAIARHCGARKVVVTDVNPDRLALGAEDGRDPRGRRFPGEACPTSRRSSG